MAVLQRTFGTLALGLSSEDSFGCWTFGVGREVVLPLDAGDGGWPTRQVVMAGTQTPHQSLVQSGTSCEMGSSVWSEGEPTSHIPIGVAAAGLFVEKAVETATNGFRSVAVSAPVYDYEDAVPVEEGSCHPSNATEPAGHLAVRGDEGDCLHSSPLTEHSPECAGREERARTSSIADDPDGSSHAPEAAKTGRLPSGTEGEAEAAQRDCQVGLGCRALEQGGCGDDLAPSPEEAPENNEDSGGEGVWIVGKNKAVRECITGSDGCAHQKPVDIRAGKDRLSVIGRDEGIRSQSPPAVQGSGSPSDAEGSKDGFVASPCHGTVIRNSDDELRECGSRCSSIGSPTKGPPESAQQEESIAEDCWSPAPSSPAVTAENVIQSVATEECTEGESRQSDAVSEREREVTENGDWWDSVNPAEEVSSGRSLALQEEDPSGCFYDQAPLGIANRDHLNLSGSATVPGSELSACGHSGRCENEVVSIDGDDFVESKKVVCQTESMTRHEALQSGDEKDGPEDGPEDVQDSSQQDRRGNEVSASIQPGMVVEKGANDVLEGKGECILQTAGPVEGSGDSILKVEENERDLCLKSVKEDADQKELQSPSSQEDVICEAPPNDGSPVAAETLADVHPTAAAKDSDGALNQTGVAVAGCESDGFGTFSSPNPSGSMRAEGESGQTREVAGVDDEEVDEFGDFEESPAVGINDDDDDDEFGDFQECGKDEDFGSFVEPGEGVNGDASGSEVEFGDFRESVEPVASQCMQQQQAGGIQQIPNCDTKDITSLRGEDFVAEVSRIFQDLGEDPEDNRNQQAAGVCLTQGRITACVSLSSWVSGPRSSQLSVI